MELKNKIIAGLSGLGLAATVAVVGLDQACVFDAEVLNVEENKICFDTKADYKTYKDDRILLYELDTPYFLWTDKGTEFMAVLNHEIKKKGKLNVGKLDKNKNLLDKIVKLIK